MRSWEKAVERAHYADEAQCLKQLEEYFKDALHRVNMNIMMLNGSQDLSSKVYQKKYQQALRDQISAALDQLHGEEYSTINDYLTKAYQNGYVGTMYSIAHQGIPIIAPIDQDMMMRSIVSNTKLSESLYQSIGIDVDKLKKTIREEITRGIASGEEWNRISLNIELASGIPMRRAETIARTEGHRIQQEATDDARHKAKESGADVLKQWDATLDSNVRPAHQELDGQIREIDEPFTVDGQEGQYPGGFGDPALDINCRCVALTRARWAMDQSELDTLKERAKHFGLDKTKDFAEFESKYLKIDHNENVTSQATESQHYRDIINNGGTEQTIGGMQCAVHQEMHGFADGTHDGTKKPVKATVYTTKDGTDFFFPNKLNKKNQTMTPDMMLEAFSKIPDNVREKMQKTVQVVDYYNTQDKYWRKVYKNFTHSYAVGGEEITYFRATYHDPEYLVESLIHEGGHFIDTHIDGYSNTNRYCKDNAWIEAMKADEKTSGKKSWRAYGQNDESEDFADSVSYFITKTAQFEKLFPARTALLKELLK